MATKYRCTLCTEGRYTKDDLIDHIEENHRDNIPEGWSAGRLAFKMIHNKTQGTCIVCKGATEWNEQRCKYQRLCNNPKCRKTLREAALKNHIKVYGKSTLLTDMKHQEKMLAGRRISGTYTFPDGVKIGYVGSFEKNFLEFMDTVLHCNGNDIQEPGPILDYSYNGSTHQWITDFLYIPYNLIIEIKDGGSNPNRKDMTDSRQRQIYKEKMITNLGTYNYLRLTNNNFEQLLEIFADLKMQMIDDTNENTKAVIRINESGAFFESTMDIIKIDQVKGLMAKSSNLSKYLNKPNIDIVLNRFASNVKDIGLELLPTLEFLLLIFYVEDLRFVLSLILRSLEIPATAIGAGVNYLYNFLKNKKTKPNILPVRTNHLPEDYKMLCYNSHIPNIINANTVLSAGYISAIFNVSRAVKGEETFFLKAWFKIFKWIVIVLLLDQMFAVDILVLRKDGDIDKMFQNKDKVCSRLSLETDIVAVNDGIIVATSDYKIRDTELGKQLTGLTLGAAGNYIIIMHEPGNYSLYCHLQHNTLKVKPGDLVKQGQVIAKMGHTGNSSTPHLHFEMTYLTPFINQTHFCLSKPLTSFKYQGQSIEYLEAFKNSEESDENFKQLLRSDIWKNYKDNQLPNLGFIKEA